jgi:hypothetical protein
MPELTQAERDDLDASVTRCKREDPGPPLFAGIVDGLFSKDSHTLCCAVCGESWALWWAGIYRHTEAEHARLVDRVWEQARRHVRENHKGRKPCQI